MTAVLSKNLPYFLDPLHWNNHDKDWIANRKAEWKQIQNVIKLRGRSLYPINGYLKAFKAFYFKGEITFSTSEQQLLKAGNGFLSAHTLIWFHPVLSSDVCESIVDFYDSSSKAAHRLSCEMTFKNGRDSQYNSAYGMMGGREKWVVDTLCCEETLRIMDRHNVSYRGYLGQSTAPRNLYDGLIHVLKGGTNPWHPGQYIWDHTMPLLNETLFKDGSRRDNYLKLCKSIFYFDDHELTAKDNSFSLALRNDLLSKFENMANIPEELAKLWSRAVEEGPN